MRIVMELRHLNNTAGKKGTKKSSVYSKMRVNERRGAMRIMNIKCKIK